MCIERNGGFAVLHVLHIVSFRVLHNIVIRLIIGETQCFRSSQRRCSVRKGVLRNSAKFTGKYLCQRPLASGLQLY